ncbi:AAA family ATPase [Rhizobium arsenicireducens]
MIRKLEYSVSFASTGRTFNEAVLFQGGFGAITGPNESGKSMILEMIRFCLFGTAALRGKSEDYKNLKAELDFRVRDQGYVVQRRINNATLLMDGNPVAVGIKPVNLKISQILGFGLDVFDMACVANQDELTSLGSMAPTERRRRVDSVIGVAVLDDLARLAGDEANVYKRSADELAASAHEPVQPLAPEGYRPSADLAVEKAKLDEVRSQADQLRGWLAIERTKPARPEEKVSMEIDFLQGMVDAQTARRIERSSLEDQARRIPPASEHTQAELDADAQLHRLQQQFRARRQFLTHTPQPECDQKQLDAARAAWKAHKDWLKLQHLEKARAELLAKGEHTCPSCTHHWPIAGDAVTNLDLEIAQFSNCVLQEVPPSMTEAVLERHQRVLDGWDDTAWQQHKDSPTADVEPRWTIDQRVQLANGIDNRERRLELLAKIELLKPSDKEPDWAAMLRTRQQYEAQLAVWSGQVAEFEKWETERQQKLIQLAMLDVDLQDYPSLVLLLDQARGFEASMLHYQTTLDTYNRLVGQIVAYRADAEDWNKVKEALKLLRLKIKQYLIPSLNRVASSLINHMTGGERQVIFVDDEFNITVDGQAIDTLSGSGKAVANLALRLGLGQVLTNNIFSLFMGDEIDASMDKNRAEKTSGVLHTLKGRISQILLVSHKFPSADYYIALGEPNDQDILAD